MVRILTQLSAALVLMIGLVPTTHAETPWVVDPGRSEVTFEYVKDGAPTEGLFREFEGSGTFDPDNPTAARFELRIRSKSIDLFDSMASGFATSAEWFDSANHPNVVYLLNKLTPISEGTYLAEGDITIRGKTDQLRSNLSLSFEGTTAKATGTLTIKRTDFLLGVGPSALFVEIGPDVLVSFALVAQQAR